MDREIDVCLFVSWCFKPSQPQRERERERERETVVLAGLHANGRCNEGRGVKWVISVTVRGLRAHRVIIRRHDTGWQTTNPDGETGNGGLGDGELGSGESGPSPIVWSIRWALKACCSLCDPESQPWPRLQSAVTPTDRTTIINKTRFYYVSVFGACENPV